ncbi:MAG: acetyl-CoA carboxylase biotin carboxyl carrier protein [Candidatus Aminicenantes bacterium]|nr:MAG: acetyl-CoA carboxylase biotin carboxyl carrier protein [Candidatus Aminicenantes bacterium]
MSSKIDYKEIIKIIDLLEERKLSHFELEVEGFKIKITKIPPSSPQDSPPAIQPTPEPEENALPSESNLQEAKNDLHTITSPMVGTFYRAPDPSSSPFVEEGDKVKRSQTLCIIEAMKLMNEIESDVNGILKEIYVENGKPVEYGQVLFAIQPLP